MKCQSTRVLAPFRACALVCSEVSPVYEPYINLPIQGEFCCPIDSTVCIYSVKPFRLHTITDPIDVTIKALARFDKLLYAIGGQDVFVFKYYKLFKKFRLDAAPRLILPCGNEAFVVVDETNKLLVFKLAEQHCAIEVEFPESFAVTAMIHPIGYLNQVLLGSEDGRLRLVDVEKGALLQEFPADCRFKAPITVLEQSTAADVVAVGHMDGRIQLRHLKLDRILFSFRHEGHVTALSFRTDDVNIMVSGSSDGSIAVWDLEKKLLIGRKAEAHIGPVVSLNFLLGEAFFVTSGTDNRLVKWVLKNENALPELVKEIEGPSEPVTSLTFTGSRSLLFASKDGKVRQYFSFQKDNSLKSLGVAREVNKKNIGKNRFLDKRMPSIVEMDTVHSREATWDNVICRHENSPFVSTWSTRRLTRGSHLLCHERFTKDPQYLACYATSIFLSCCGTYALIGYSSGHFDVFNVQSGRLRNSFSFSSDTKRMLKSSFSTEQQAHSSKVTGVALDMLNQTAVSGSADGYISFWSFKTGAILSRISNSTCSGVTRFCLNRFNSLLAVGIDNGDITVVDVLCRKVARHFQRAHMRDAEQSAEITAMTFSADGKWLASADSNCMLKIWDLASSSLIDVMRMEIICKTLCFNETGEFLATAHEGQRAVYVWANLTMFLPDFNVLSLESTLSDERSVICKLPQLGSANAGDCNLEEEEDEDNGNNDTSLIPCKIVVIDEDDEKMDEDASLSIISSDNNGQLMLSGFPPSKWANFAYLDLIRERNKPIEPPKKPENAPFFLPTTENLQGFTFEKINDHESEEGILQNGDLEMENRSDTKENVAKSNQPKAVLMAKRLLDTKPETTWAKSLIGCNNHKKLLDAFQNLKAMNVSSIDFQIRMLPFTAIRPFLIMITLVLEQRECFDLVQGYLAAFMNAHYETLHDISSESDDLEERKLIIQTLQKVLSLQKEVWKDVQEFFYTNTSLSKWIKSAVI